MSCRNKLDLVLHSCFIILSSCSCNTSNSPTLHSDLKVSKNNNWKSQCSSAPVTVNLDFVFCVTNIRIKCLNLAAEVTNHR